MISKSTFEENLVKLCDKSAVGFLVHRMKFAPERGWPWSSILQGVWTFARCFNMMVPYATKIDSHLIDKDYKFRHSSKAMILTGELKLLNGPH